MMYQLEVYSGIDDILYQYEYTGTILSSIDPAWAGLPSSSDDPSFIRKVPRTFITTYIAPVVSFVIKKTVDFF
jgi:hypothetical protein